jgi:hypothetical protein
MDDKKCLPSLPGLPVKGKYEEVFSGIAPTYSPETVLGKAKIEIEKYHKDNKYELSNTALVQAMSLKEFDTSQDFRLATSKYGDYRVLQHLV